MNAEQLNPVSITTFAGKENAGRRALLVLGLLTFVVSPVRAEDPALTPSALETNPQGWTNIMPPADLKGWSRVPVPPGGKLGRAQWHVVHFSLYVALSLIADCCPSCAPPAGPSA